MTEETATRYDDAILKIATVALRIINIVIFVMLCILLVFGTMAVFYQPSIAAELSRRGMHTPGGSVVPWILLLMAAGAAILVLAMRFFATLLKLMATVERGDPFVPENARRLRAMAWLLLAMEVVGFCTGAYASMVFKHSYGFDFSVTGLVAVLSLFVLARVFARGTAMRDEIEGTV
ncbi:MAG: DUF2975 domain-containing protein [Novosphingobium sp.]|nr:DUF2975 domain-containing protein [Novosphingobium sp.]